MEKALKIISILLILFIVIFLSIGYSAFQSSLVVSDIKSIVRAYADIRVTGVTASGANNGYTSYDEYDVTSIESEIVLPNTNSTITYNVEITNLGSQDMALTNITGLPNTMEIKNINYTYGTKLCDNTRCHNGSINTITFTVGYKSTVTEGTNNSTLIHADFIFKKVFSITYNNFADTTGLPVEILESSTITIDMSGLSNVPSNITTTGAQGTYTNSTLTLSNPSGDVTVTAVSGNSEVIENEDGTTTTVTETTTENQDGSTTTLINKVITDSGGNVVSTSETETTTTTNQDGSSSSTSNTTNYDASGNVTSTSETATTTNVNGSSNSTTTTYDVNGTPISGSTNTVDTSGNSNTQEVAYDSQGNTVVTAYTIDTSANQNGGETIDDSIETGFIPFDGSSDWELNMTFIYNSENNSTTTAATTVAILGCSDWTGGTFNGGFTFRIYNYKNTGSSTATSTYKYNGMLKYRTQLQIENQESTGATIAYMINTNNSGAIMTSPMTYTIHASKIGSQMTLTISPNSELTYNPTRNENTTAKGLTTASAGTEFTKTWTANDNSASTDITIGGYMSSSGEISQKANIEVLDFSVRKI